MKNTILFALVLALTACTSQSDADSALKALGMTNIQYTGYSLFACSKDDTFHTGFTATNPQGQQVTGTVCSGVFKGATVRFKDTPTND